MRLLLDQNLSPRLVPALLGLYPASTHVRELGLQTADDDTVWRYAAEHGFAIVSKDADFHERSFLLGHPTHGREQTSGNYHIFALSLVGNIVAFSVVGTLCWRVGHRLFQAIYRK